MAKFTTPGRNALKPNAFAAPKPRDAMAGNALSRSVQPGLPPVKAPLRPKVKTKFPGAK